MSEPCLYYGPHIHAAVHCLLAGRRDNAVSWMTRDLSEERPLQWPIDPASLTLYPADSRVEFQYIQFRWLRPAMIGEGI